MANEQESGLFRKEALEQLSSPEQLDQLIQVVSLKDWMPLAAIGFLVSIILTWSVFGRIPTYVEAKGLLLKQSADTQPLISVSYFPIAAGRQIQPGDSILVIPDTVRFQDSGGLQAIVTSVSPTPVTQNTLLNRINGNQELAALVYSPAAIEVVAALQPAATPTGYQWSIAEGPRISLASETPMTARVTIKEQAPIALVFPFLRQ